MKTFLGIIVLFVIMTIVIGRLKALTCAGESPGTMVVINGTSTRCN